MITKIESSKGILPNGAKNENSHEGVKNVLKEKSRIEIYTQTQNFMNKTLMLWQYDELKFHVKNPLKCANISQTCKECGRESGQRKIYTCHAYVCRTIAIMRRNLSCLYKMFVYASGFDGNAKIQGNVRKIVSYNFKFLRSFQFGQHIYVENKMDRKKGGSNFQ